MTNIQKVKEIAKRAGIDFEDITPSPNKQKKYRIYIRGQSPVDFGATGYSDFLIHKDEERRQRFHNRFKNNPSINNPTSGLYYSARILW